MWALGRSLCPSALPRELDGGAGRSKATPQRSSAPLKPLCRRGLAAVRPACLQSNENRYRLLEGKHVALVAEKEKLFQENETLRQVGPTGQLVHVQACWRCRSHLAAWRSGADASASARYSAIVLQELTSARMEHSKAQTALMAKDAELERHNVEISSLQSDKASLDKLLQVLGRVLQAACGVLVLVLQHWVVLVEGPWRLR